MVYFLRPKQLNPDTIPPIIHIESIEIPGPQTVANKQTDSLIQYLR
jgi:hypothetical protein